MNPAAPTGVGGKDFRIAPRLWFSPSFTRRIGSMMLPAS
jgi:hypothetical protein